MSADTADFDEPLVATVPENTAPGRADKILADLLPQLSRSQIQRLMEEGRVTLLESAVFTVHGESPSPPPPASNVGQASCLPLSARRALDRRDRLAPGDTIALDIPPTASESLVPAEIALDVLFEDKHLLAVNKPGGMVTHPGAGTGGDTLAHAALGHTGGALALAGGLSRPGIVHRLDKETSGVILLAKTDEAYSALVRQFSERELDKQYLALVAPCPGLLSGSAHDPIGRHRTNRLKMMVCDDGKPAHTDWQVEERFGTAAARLRCHLHTGRTHQIRVHLSHMGYPILGDVTYGYGKKNKPDLSAVPVPRVLLHAERIALAHPVTGKPLLLVAPVPADFLKTQDLLRTTFGGREIVKITGH